MWTVFSALLSALSQPNEIFLYGNWLLGLFCLVPLYLALTHTQKLKEAGILGVIFGAFHHALTSYWLFFYKDFAFWTLGTTTIAYAVVYSAAIIYGWFILRHAGNVRPIVFAILWAAFEFAKSTGFLGYPWGLLPYSFTAVPLMQQTADIWGVYGISAFLAFVSASISEYILQVSFIQKKGNFFHNPSIFWIFLCFLIGVSFLIYGYNRIHYPFPVSKSVRVLLCQQNTDPWRSG
jgi:apolipoprotein N-acyltransferase